MVLTAIVSEAKYCLGNPGPIATEYQPPDAVTLRLRVRVSYRNAGLVPLIIPIYHELSAVVISRTPASRRNQPVIRFKRRQEPIDELPEEVSPDNPFNPLFKVIPPGGVLDKYFSESVVLRVHNPSSEDPQSELLGRKIYLRLELAHLGLSQRLRNEVAAKWLRYGYLWTGKIRSRPIEIEIPASPQIADCSHEYVL